MTDPIPVGKIPSGLFIVTARDGEKRDGFLGSWVQQASFEPLLISMAVKPGRPALEMLRKTGRFCVNVVGHRNNGLLKPFWGGLKPGEDPLDAVSVAASERGNWILNDALAVLECETRDIAQPGDHAVVFGEVVEARLLNPEDKPMTHVRKSGAGY
jgi:flavin reductase (DIM6/NTAB) family NADH-FMN oxidoreductase RutF